jgi:hypothetical protein
MLPRIAVPLGFLFGQPTASPVFCPGDRQVRLMLAPRLISVNKIPKNFARYHE